MKPHSPSIATGLIPVAIAAVALSGCAPKPPACDDAAVASTIHQLVMDHVTDSMDLKKPIGRDALSGYYFTALSLKAMPRATDREHIPGLQQAALAGYTGGASTILSAVTTDGYDSQARRHSCKATIKLQSKATGQTMEVRGVPYTVQGTAKAGEFLVESPGLDEFIATVGKDAIDHVVSAITKGLPALRAPDEQRPAAPPALVRPDEEEHGD